MLCYAMLESLEPKKPLLQVKGKGREANCLFLSYSTSKRRGKVLGKVESVVMLWNDEGVFPNVDFCFVNTHVV